MNQENYLFFTISIIFLLFIFFRFYKSYRMKKILPELIKKGAIIIDVRSTNEFNEGSNPHSINIPLDQISEQKFSNFNKDSSIVLCCASGMRSGVAANLVKNFGFKEVINAGPWTNTLF